MHAQDSSNTMEQLNNTGALALEADEAAALASTKYTSLLADAFAGIEGLALYCSEVEFGVNNGGENGTIRDTNIEELEEAAAPITAAVLAAGGECKTGVYHLESCVQVSVCLLEAEVGESVPVHIFSTYVESTTVVPDLLEGTAIMLIDPVDILDKDCESASFLDEFSASSERQWSAVSIASLVEQASATFQKAAREKTLGVESFQDIWHSACTALNCDASSMLDIVHAVNGHAAELINVKAPAALIRTYLIAVRKNEVSIKKMDSDLAQALSVILGGDSSHEHATVRYDQITRRAAGSLNRARTMLLEQTAGFWNEFVGWLTSLLSCFGFMITVAVAYGRLPIMFSTPCYCMGVVISFAAFVPINWSYAGGKNNFLTAFCHLWKGDQFCLLCPIVFILSMCIGFVIAPPKPAGLTAQQKSGSVDWAKKYVSPLKHVGGWESAQVRLGVALTISIGFKPTAPDDGSDFTGTEQASEEDFTEEAMEENAANAERMGRRGICQTDVTLGISVGVLGLVAKGYPTCFFGGMLTIPFVGSFVCLKAWALSMTILCCSINITQGTNTCSGGGGCSESISGCALGRRRKRRQDARKYGQIRLWEMNNGGKTWSKKAQVKRRQRCNQGKRKAGNCKSYSVRLKEAQAKIDALIAARAKWKQQIYEDQIAKQQKAAADEAEKAAAEVDAHTGPAKIPEDPCLVLNEPERTTCIEERQARIEARFQANLAEDIARAREDCKRPCIGMHDYYEQWECNEECDKKDWEQIVDHPTYGDDDDDEAPWVPTYSSCEEGCRGMHDDMEMQECFWECR